MFFNDLRKYKNSNLKLTRFAIAVRGQTIWNKFLAESEKCYTSIDVLKNMIKEKILNFSSEFLFFKFKLSPVILFSYFIKQDIFVNFLY